MTSLTSTFWLRAALVAIVLALSGCKDKEESDDVAIVPAEPTVTVIKQPSGGDDNGSGTDTGDDDDDSGGPAKDGSADCDGLLHGEEAVQIRYREATATLGLSACISETQTLVCNDGVVSNDGTFEHESCTASPASVEEGDILVVRENSGDEVGDDGQILAFSPTTGYKGYAFDATDIVPWYAYGLHLTFDRMADKYFVEVGSSDADLAIQVKRFPWVQSYPYVLESPTDGDSSDALYFQGAFSEEYNTLRHLAKADGAEIHVYSSGNEIGDCKIDMPAGDHARVIYSGTQHFVFSPHVAYTIGTGVAVTGYGVGKLSGGTCSSPGGTPQTVSTLFEDTAYPEAKITSVLEVRTADGGGVGSWKNDIFVTVGPFLGSQQVKHWHYDTGSSTWSEQTSPFVDSASAVFQDNWGDIYTIESDGTSTFLRRYSTMESGGTHLVSTVHTDADASVLADTGLGQWLVVMPELP